MSRSVARLRSGLSVILILPLIVLAFVVATAGSAGAVDEPAPSGTRTATGPLGQTLSVTPADGLAHSGAEVHVTGSGYDTSVGIYLSLCVDNGPGIAPSPCVGGVDMTGSSGASYWISSNPPSYGIGLTEPFTDAGGFELTLTLSSGDEFVDCFDPDTRCVVATRADHTNSGVRSADVFVPVSFAGQDPIDDSDDGPTPTSTTTTTTVPENEVPLAAAPSTSEPTPTTATQDLGPVVEVAGEELSNTATVQGSSDVTQADSTGEQLAFTGATSNWLLGIAAALLIAGAVLQWLAAPSNDLDTEGRRR